MKRLFALLLAGLLMLLACTPENTPNNGGGNTQPTVVDLTGIALTEHEITLEKGGNKVLDVKFTPENATNKTLTWVSSNTSIVTVTDGIVVGVAPGKTEIIVKSGNLTDKCQVTVIIYAASMTLDQTELTLTLGETATLKATVLPEDSTDEVEWSSSDEAIVAVKDGEVTAVAKGEATITAKAGDKTSTCSVKVKNKVPEEAVDLGLSVYWAECNLGAEKPEDYGNYYAWGEVETKKEHSWSTYKWGSSSTHLTKYNTVSSHGSVDNKTVLESEDDAAQVKLGGNWRMPTDEEWNKLMTKCTWDYTTWNGVKGYFVTAPNGNSIFLPAAGFWVDSYLYNAGFDGHYWSSSLSYPPFDAECVCFDPFNVYWKVDGRCYGFSIRPVSE